MSFDTPKCISYAFRATMKKISVFPECRTNIKIKKFKLSFKKIHNLDFLITYIFCNFIDDGQERLIGGWKIFGDRGSLRTPEFPWYRYWGWRVATTGRCRDGAKSFTELKNWTIKVCVDWMKSIMRITSEKERGGLPRTKRPLKKNYVRIIISFINADFVSHFVHCALRIHLIFFFLVFTSTQTLPIVQSINTLNK